MNRLLEQSFAIKFFINLDKIASKTNKIIKMLTGNMLLGRSSVFEWHEIWRGKKVSILTTNAQDILQWPKLTRTWCKCKPFSTLTAVRVCDIWTLKFTKNYYARNENGNDKNVCKIGAEGVDRRTERQTSENVSRTFRLCSWLCEFFRKCYYRRWVMDFRVWPKKKKGQNFELHTSTSFHPEKARKKASRKWNPRWLSLLTIMESSVKSFCRLVEQWLPYFTGQCLKDCEN